MSPRRTRSQKFRDSSQVPEQEAAELRNNRFTLFIQQYEKEAHERISEMEARMDNMLKTVDKFFKVELMKMPPSLQRTLIGDLIDHGVTSSDVSIAIKTNSPEIQRPLKRTSSRKGRSSPAESVQGQKPSAKSQTGGKVVKSRGLVVSASAGNLGFSSGTVKRTLSRVAKGVDPAVKTKQKKLRAISSAGDLCSVAGFNPHVTITTSQGQRFCLSEETKDNIALDLLDDVAMFQIQQLMRLMDYLSSKAKPAEE
ncbi:borealin-2 [Gadus morhua]|uniref:borealin-2 n=1 Tax=Gadus morhua TaxID=8049 RepID=UPI0011B7EFC9|nr:borealin-2-like [Gadus morhua]